MEQAREGIFNIKNNSKGLNKLFISIYNTLTKSLHVKYQLSHT